MRFGLKLEKRLYQYTVPSSVTHVSVTCGGGGGGGASTSYPYGAGGAGSGGSGYVQTTWTSGTIGAGGAGSAYHYPPYQPTVPVVTVQPQWAWYLYCREAHYTMHYTPDFQHFRDLFAEHCPKSWLQRLRSLLDTRT